MLHELADRELSGESPVEMAERSYRVELPKELFLTALARLAPEAVERANAVHWNWVSSCLACAVVGAIVGWVAAR
jgi:hypothetical protein